MSIRDVIAKNLEHANAYSQNELAHYQQTPQWLEPNFGLTEIGQHQPIAPIAHTPVASPYSTQQPNLSALLHDDMMRARLAAQATENRAADASHARYLENAGREHIANRADEDAYFRRMGR